MKTSKKIISAFLAVLMICSILPMSSFAATNGDYEYEVLSEDEKTCIITAYTGSAQNLTIPSKIDGYTVTEIYGYGDFFEAYGAFADCDTLKSVIIPDTVTAIYDYAFYGCDSLTTVSAGKNVELIGFAAFAYCSYLKNVTVPEKCDISLYAFEGSATATTIIKIEDSDTSYDIAYKFNSVYHNSGKITECEKQLYTSENFMVYDEVAKKAAELVKGQTTELAKVKALADWIEDNIYYDYDQYTNGYTYDDPLDVLTYKRTVCRGYAGLMQMMCISVGIPCKYVSGYAAGYGYDFEKETLLSGYVNHIWNEVYADGKWRIVDTTWNSTNEYRNGQFIKKKPTDRYFDISVEKFSNNHCTLGSDFEHLDLKWENTKPSTCKTTGEKSLICGCCGEVFHKMKTYAERHMSNWYIETPADKEHNGVKRRDCTDGCGYFERAEYQYPVNGDVNGDGKIDSADSVMVLRYDAGLLELTDDQLREADMNFDGSVDTADSVMMLRFDAGLV